MQKTASRLAALSMSTSTIKKFTVSMMRPDIKAPTTQVPAA